MNQIQSGLSPMAVKGLCQSLVDFGSMASNPVLSVLSSPGKFEQDIKYPAVSLDFSVIALSAFYHFHPEPGRQVDEHGHFHIFLIDAELDGRRQTRHLATLSMDHEGQAQRWSCVNRWVTAGDWLTAKQAESGLLKLFRQNMYQRSPIERWIYYMLAAYYPRLLELMAMRDQKLQSVSTTGCHEQVFNDRSIYGLAELPVDLSADLALE